ncbi:MAG: rubrerythrin family protein [Armatimonadota bacterium]|nr:rubrerythrin family protein [Armatimonadota bacterium]MDW8026605.1 rubrerythrin family protein [Armatimonadota bacterium]
MRRMTEENMRSAFAGESQAHMRYLIFAEEARKQGFESVARLFTAIAFAEQVHATNHLRTLGGIGSTSENLAAAIAGETFEVEEMYPAYIEVAKLQGENSAEKSASNALEAERIHAALYHRAKQAVDAGKDADVSTIFVCEVCGYTVEGEAPQRCPLCGAPKDRFRSF